MSLMNRVLGRFGKHSVADTNLAEDRARQTDFHGRGLNQTAEETAGTRQRMEAELDKQRDQRNQ